MKNFTLLILLAVSFSTFANETINIDAKALGSGTPAATITQGTNSATLINDSMWHTPQYLPGYPTAAVIWPRVITVPCTETATNQLKCSGYHWKPEYGRAEYLFISPQIILTSVPVSNTQIILERTVIKEVPVIVKQDVIKEVPVKKIKQ